MIAPGTFSVPQEIQEKILAGALFVVNHSGGKDSQAMTALLRTIVPADQLLVIHADLPGVDWEGCEDHVRETCPDLPVIVVRAGKTFFEMVRHRRMFPSPQLRQCTSDLKRGPIEKAIRNWCRHTGRSIVVNCMGMRAEESSNRAKLNTFKRSERNSKAGRDWYDWLPIHRLTTQEVFDTIAGAGQRPHWAYFEGMTRLSCKFCIMASVHDLKTAAVIDQKAFEEMAALEFEIDYTLVMPRKGQPRRFLQEIVGVSNG